MPATEADIARYTSDGVLLARAPTTIRDTHPDAIDAGGSEIETFFTSEAGGQFILDERFAWQSLVGRPHDAIELASELGLGVTVPLWPIPTATIADEDRALASKVIVRAYSFDGATDRYALELVGINLKTLSGGRATMDTTRITQDNTTHTLDES